MYDFGSFRCTTRFIDNNYVMVYFIYYYIHNIQIKKVRFAETRTKILYLVIICLYLRPTDLSASVHGWHTGMGQNHCDLLIYYASIKYSSILASSRIMHVLPILIAYKS